MEKFSICGQCEGEIDEMDAMISANECSSCRTLKAEYFRGVQYADLPKMRKEQKQRRHVREEARREQTPD